MMSDTHDKFGKLQPQFVTDYLRAFAAANPDSTPPVIWDRRNGWISFGGQSKRKSEIIDMTDRLKSQSTGAEKP